MDMKTQGSVLQETEHSGHSPIKHLSTGFIFKWVGDWVAAGKAELAIPDPKCAAELALLSRAPARAGPPCPGGMELPGGIQLSGEIEAPKWDGSSQVGWISQVTALGFLAMATWADVRLPEPGAAWGGQSFKAHLRGEEGKCGNAPLQLTRSPHPPPSAFPAVLEGSVLSLSLFLSWALACRHWALSCAAQEEQPRWVKGLLSRGEGASRADLSLSCQASWHSHDGLGSVDALWIG